MSGMDPYLPRALAPIEPSDFLRIILLKSTYALGASSETAGAYNQYVTKVELSKATTMMS